MLKTFHRFLPILIGCILLASGSGAAQTHDMRGVWNGFLQSESNPPELVRTDIQTQDNRRFSGFVSPSDPLRRIVFDGTVSASGKINIQGDAADGEHIVGKSELLDFGGGAAIYNGTLTRPAVDNRFIIPCILVMRAFAPNGSAIPDPSGRFSGGITSSESTGQITFLLASPTDSSKPTSFNGSIEVILDGQTHALQMLGTISADGRLIGIAHKNGAGHMILNALLVPETAETPTTIRGTYKFELEHGVEYEGSFEAPANRAAPPTNNQ